MIEQRGFFSLLREAKMVILHVEPSVTLTWAQFKKLKSPFSIALDGYVADGPKFDPNGPWQNFNHHEAVSRLETRATCAQVLLAIRQGLFETFKKDGGNEARIFTNDCDEDVCLSVFLLRYAHLVEGTMNPAINRLVMMEDLLDTTSGAYAFPKDLPSFQKLMWVFEPYHIFRASGRLDRRVKEEFRSVISDVGMRVMAFITGNSLSVELDTRYEKLEQYHGWQMVKEIGLHARTGMFDDKIKAFVAVRERPDGRYIYTVGRVSQYIPFDVPEILRALNKAEGRDTLNNWGGGNTIGGSPRMSGSRLKPQEVAAIINEVLAKSRKN